MEYNQWWIRIKKIIILCYLSFKGIIIISDIGIIRKGRLLFYWIPFFLIGFYVDFGMILQLQVKIEPGVAILFSLIFDKYEWRYDDFRSHLKWDGNRSFVEEVQFHA